MKIFICKNLLSLFYCLAVRDFQITLFYYLQMELFSKRIRKKFITLTTYTLSKKNSYYIIEV